MKFYSGAARAKFIRMRKNQVARDSSHLEPSVGFAKGRAMKTHEEILKNIDFNFSFLSLVFSALGWLLFECWLTARGASIMGHFIFCLIGLYLAVVTIRNHRRNLDYFRSRYQPGDAAIDGLGPKLVLSILFFVAIGGIIGTFIVVSSVFSFAIVCFGMIAIPWSRVSPCVTSPHIPFIAIVSGAVIVLAPNYRIVDSFILPIACWVLWIFSVTGLVFHLARIVETRRLPATRQQGMPYPEP